MHGHSEAWEELGYGGRLHSLRPPTSPKIQMDIGATIIGMLDEAKKQSESQNMAYIFLSRIDGILSLLEYMDGSVRSGEKTGLILQTGEVWKVSSTLLDQHLLWKEIISKYDRAYEHLIQSMMSVRIAYNRTLTINDNLATQWKKADKTRLEGIVSTKEEYKKLIKYFSLRYFGKSLEDFLNSQ